MDSPKGSSLFPLNDLSCLVHLIVPIWQYFFSSLSKLPEVLVGSRLAEPLPWQITKPVKKNFLENHW